MKQIVDFNIARLRVDEDFGFLKRVETLARAELQAEAVSTAIEAYAAAVTAFDEALKQNSKNSYTKTVAAADVVADGRWVALCNYGRSLPGHPSADAAAIGGRVAEIVKKYGNISESPYEEEYSLMWNALQEFRALGAEALETVHLTAWVDALEQAYAAFTEARAAQVNEEASRRVGVVKEMRNAADAAYRILVQKVNALAVVMGDADYAAFIDSMNVMIAAWQADLKARDTRAANAEEKEATVPADGETLASTE